MPNPVLEAFAKNPTILLLVTAWSLAWKGLALWRAAKNDQKYWFVALLVVNTLGLVEVAYLVWFAKKDRYWEKITKGQVWKKPKSSSTKHI